MMEPRVADYLGRFTELSPDEASREVPAAVRSYLEAARSYLREIHLVGATGREANEAHSDMIDRLLRRLCSKTTSVTTQHLQACRACSKRCKRNLHGIRDYNMNPSNFW